MPCRIGKKGVCDQAYKMLFHLSQWQINAFTLNFSQTVTVCVVNDQSALVSETKQSHIIFEVTPKLYLLKIRFAFKKWKSLQKSIKLLDFYLNATKTDFPNATSQTCLLKFPHTSQLAGSNKEIGYTQWAVISVLWEQMYHLTMC